MKAACSAPTGATPRLNYMAVITACTYIMCSGWVEQSPHFPWSTKVQMPKRRVNVYFSEQVFEELTKIAEERGKTLSDVLRDAVTLEKYAFDTAQAGGRLLVEKPDGETREIITR
jgi:hypothetical protein